MKYMSSVDTTREKQVAKQYKSQTSPYKASVTHNNKLGPNGGSRRRAVGAIAAYNNSISLNFLENSINFKRWINFWELALLKRVSGSTLLRNAKKLDKSLQMTSMPGYFK